MSNIGKIDGVRLKVVNDEITVNVATDAQLETGTQEELENLVVTAWQTKRVRTDLTSELANKTNLDMDNISDVGKSAIVDLDSPSDRMFNITPTWEGLSAFRTFTYTPSVSGFITLQATPTNTNNATIIISSNGLVLERINIVGFSPTLISQKVHKGAEIVFEIRVPEVDISSVIISFIYPVGVI